MPSPGTRGRSIGAPATGVGVAGTMRGVFGLSGCVGFERKKGAGFGKRERIGRA